MTTHWDESFDWISIGSGLGGCAGAAAAADAGLQAVVLEKTPLLGGSTTYSYGILWVPNNHLERREGVQDSPDLARRYMVGLGSGREWAEHVETYIRHAPEALEYFERVGDVRMYPVRGLPDHSYPVVPGSLEFGRCLQAEPFPAAGLGEWQPLLRHSPYVEYATFEEIKGWGGMGNERGWDRTVLARREAEDARTFGAGLAGTFARAALKTGARVLTEAAAQRLIVEDGAVVGVEVSRRGETVRLQARKGVLLATGSYGANVRLSTWFDEVPPYATRRAPGASSGDGMVMAMEQGAAIIVQHGLLAVHLAYAVPEEGGAAPGGARGTEATPQGTAAAGTPSGRGSDAGASHGGDLAAHAIPAGREASIREVAAPHTVLVNRDGERFSDESNFEHVALKQREFDLWRHQYVNRPCFLVFDQQFWEAYGLGPHPPGSAPPDWLARGNTPRELAQKLGINPDRLEQTLERFNRFVEQGQDEDFHRGEGVWIRQVTGDLTQRKNPNLGSVERPPFYGLELHQTDTRSAGLVIDTLGRVIHVRGHPIPGLYACGEVAAQMHVGVGYQAGFTLTGAMTSGYLAARHAASEH